MAALYTGSFELRRCLVKWRRTPSGGTVEDVDVITFHLAKLVSGAPDPGWTAANYTACEARIITMWTTLKTKYPATTALSEVRWYKDGPVFSPDDLANGPANPADRITAIGPTGGTSITNDTMPPQVAVAVTKIIAVRKRWGRMYLPAPTTDSGNVDGRIATPNNFLAPFVTLFNGFRADGFQPVVFSRGRSAYTTHRGTAIPSHVASAYEITDLQADDLWDVMRSRRYGSSTIRTRTTLT